MKKILIKPEKTNTILVKDIDEDIHFYAVAKDKDGDVVGYVVYNEAVDDLEIINTAQDKIGLSGNHLEDLIISNKNLTFYLID